MHVSFSPVPVMYCIEIIGGIVGRQSLSHSLDFEFLEDRDHILLILVVPVPGKSVWILADFL